MTKNKEDKTIELSNTGEIELPKIDVEKHIGKKIPIIAVEEHEGIHGYYIKVICDAVETIERGQDEEIILRPSRIFGLFTDKNGKIGWGKDTKLGVFLKDMGVMHYNDLPGKKVIVQTSTSKDGTKFLTF